MVDSPPATAVAPAPRRRRQPPRGLRRIGPGAWVLLVAGAAAASLWGYRTWERHHATVRFAVPPGGSLPALDLTFFPEQLAFAAPSPPPPLGSLRLDGAAAVTVGHDLVPERAVLRYGGAGFGTGFTFLTLGMAPPAIVLRPPQPIRGRLGEPVAVWSFGWRCSGLVPIAGAEVVAMGGGEHGIPLGAAKTSADGRFTIDGVDLAAGTIGLRIKAPGFAIAHHAVTAGEVSGPDGSAVVVLDRAVPRRGRLQGPAGFDPTRLRVLARGLPGVEATPAADGSFALEHVPHGQQPRLLLHGLPAGLAYPVVRAPLVADAVAAIDVVPGAAVRGRVVDATTRRGLPGALVYWGDDAIVRADADGSFVLDGLLPGVGELTAQWEYREGRRRPLVRFGRTPLQLRGGQVENDLVVLVH